jgi:3-deoxy-manno-octulosonate cytidylyltransferase (CMP-KDO synthetase)
MEKVNDICFCIPARIGSSRLKNKLLLKFNGESCIRRTIKKVLNSKYYKSSDNLIVLTDSNDITAQILDLPCQIIINTDKEYINGTERIIDNLNVIDNKFKYILNIQADEPYISTANIDYLIEKKSLFNNNTTNNNIINLNIINNELFYMTLHEENNSIDYLKSTGSLKLVTDKYNNVLYYSRNIIPWNKTNKIIPDYIYKTFTGLYLFDRNKLKLLKDIDTTPLQNMEDCEQLKILENGWKIKSFSTIEYNEISLNTLEDYEYLKKKYT